jgi:hypothetical protein
MPFGYRPSCRCYANKITTDDSDDEFKGGEFSYDKKCARKGRPKGRKGSATSILGTMRHLRESPLTKFFGI